VGQARGKNQGCGETGLYIADRPHQACRVIQKACERGIDMQGERVVHIILPYNQTVDDLELEPAPHRPVEESLEWLALEGNMPGERERIITATAVLLEKGVDLYKALDTAIIWERG
jgi:hypothetical protein